MIVSAVRSLGIRGLDPALAVLVDAGSCTNLFATRDDVLLPHASVGAIMSGLLSRTVFDPADPRTRPFHGVKSFPELVVYDLSNAYIEAVSFQFHEITGDVPSCVLRANGLPRPDGRGRQEALSLASRYRVDDSALIDVGISEVTRAILRSKPRLLLLSVPLMTYPHLLHLVSERQIVMAHESAMSFSCALIR